MKKTRNFKKVLSMVLTLVMVLSTMMLVPLTIGAEDEPVELQGAGTAENPFLVGSKAELDLVLAELAAFYYEDLYVKLTADIDLESTAFSFVSAVDAADAPVPAAYIAWNIDGAGYTISNTVAPLFVSAKNVTIKNLNVVTAQTVAEGNAAGLIDQLQGRATIENCTVSGALTATAGIAGGFIAVMDATKVKTVTIANSINEADITAATYAGGFIAKVASGSVEIDGCGNSGDVTTTCNADAKDSESSAAGFVGWQHDKNVLMVTVKNAINLGTITPANGVGAAFAGHAKSSYVTLENCADDGLVVRPLFGTDNRETVVATNTATLAEVMAMIAQPKTPASKLNADPWDGITTTEPALQNPDAPNSAENPYLIGTAAELAYFSYHADRMIAVDYWAKLTADINLGGVVFLGMLTAVDANTPIDVTIDGDNYTIYNATVTGYTRGFFMGYPGETAPSSSVIGDLTLSNLHFAYIIGEKSSSSTGGVVAGSITGGSTTTLTNVTADATCIMVTESDNSSVGGLVGNTQNCTFIADKCLSEVTLVSAGTSPALALPTNSNGTRHGGIIGITNTDSTVTITNTIGGSGMGQYITASYRVGAIVGVVLAESNFTFTNVFALSGLANVGCRYGTPSITNCYGPFEVAQAGNAVALAAINCAIVGAHNYANDCDTDCDDCGATRTIEHVYDNACDTTCNVCAATRTTAHVYTNDSDIDCNVCGATRTVTPPAADNTTNNTTNNTDNTTKAPETTAAAEDAKAKGCKKSIDSTYAVIALIAVLGFAFVAKKREEN